MAIPVVLLFSGQGSQKVGMGRDLVGASPVVAEMVRRADEILGFRLSEVMFEGPMEELTRTSRCQPALYVHGLALLELLRGRCPELEVQACAGLSLGEFTAHAAAGTFGFEEGLKLVFQRGSFMEEACLVSKGGMVAMIGGSEEQVRELAAVCDVDVANLNSPGQIVLSGDAERVAAAAERAKEFGVKRAIPLPVAGAYHSRLMMGAQERLAAVLEQMELREDGLPVVSNFEARALRTAGEVRGALTRQVTGSVRWVESIQGLIAGGHRLFVELGPDAVLAGMIGKIDKTVQVISIKDLESLDAGVAALAG